LRKRGLFIAKIGGVEFSVERSEDSANEGVSIPKDSIDDTELKGTKNSKSAEQEQENNLALFQHLVSFWCSNVEQSR